MYLLNHSYLTVPNNIIFSDSIFTFTQPSRAHLAEMSIIFSINLVWLSSSEVYAELVTLKTITFFPTFFYCFFFKSLRSTDSRWEKTMIRRIQPSGRLASFGILPPTSTSNITAAGYQHRDRVWREWFEGSLQTTPQYAYTESNHFNILLNQTEIRLYLPFYDWFGNKWSPFGSESIGKL